MIIGVDLATSRYQEQDLILARGLVPVGISIGEPRFHLRYSPVFMTRLAPRGLRDIGDKKAIHRALQGTPFQKRRQRMFV